MDNIFENAYFGKPYRTRDGRKALYHCFDGQYHRLITSERCDFSPYCNDNGKYINHSEEESPFDIISEWQEEISEEELDELANKEYMMPALKEAFKIGYHKALEL